MEYIWAYYSIRGILWFNLKWILQTSGRSCAVVEKSNYFRQICVTNSSSTSIGGKKSRPQKLNLYSSTFKIASR